MTERRPIGWGLVWTLVGFLVVLIEGYAVGTPKQGDTLSEVLHGVRFDPLGRFVLLPLGCWLAWHWFLRPQSMSGLSWRDGVALGVGLLWALKETFR